MIEDTLRSIGFTEGEIRIYLALLDIGSTTTGSIIKKSKISGSKVYEVLDRLIEKSIVSYTIKNNVKYFESASPERILLYVEEKQNQINKEKLEIQKIIPDLILRQNNNHKKSEAKIFIGFEGLKTVNEDIINTLKRGEEWLSMGLTEQPESWELYFTQRQKIRSEKGIILKHLLNEKYKSLYYKRKNLKFTEFRFLSKELEMPTSTEVYANKVLIFILIKESPMAILIENEHIANSFRKYFYVLWKAAKK